MFRDPQMSVNDQGSVALPQLEGVLPAPESTGEDADREKDDHLIELATATRRLQALREWIVISITNRPCCGL